MILRCLGFFLLVCLTGMEVRSQSAPDASDSTSTKIWGAVYVPFNAYNAPQLWKNFNLAETRSDFGYAQKLNLNALRIWASYEYWLEEPEKFKADFDQMLDAAREAHLRILISLFDSNGVAPTPENMRTTDPAKAFCIRSPSNWILSHPGAWAKPREYVTWFMKNYASDDRLLGIEVFNEPRGPEFKFTQEMLRTARSMKGTVPLTLGTDTVQWAERFIPDGLDVIQFHNNFPVSQEEFEQNIHDALAVGAKYRRPVWMTEWQWVRPSGPGWQATALTEKEKNPDYASLAAIVRQESVGAFFWSLMVKRAYLPGQRKNGTINGVFFPDGSVWSLADARAIAGDPGLQLPVKKDRALP